MESTKNQDKNVEHIHREGKAQKFKHMTKMHKDLMPTRVKIEVLLEVTHN